MKIRERKGFGKMLALLLSAAMILTMSGINEVGRAWAATNVKVTITKPGISYITLKKGESYKIGVSVTPSSQKKKIKFISSKKSVAKVSSKGVIKALKKGTAIIKITDAKKAVKAKIKVSVVTKLKKVTKVALNTKAVTMKPGEQVSLKTTISPKNATVKNVVYTTSDKATVIVNGKGMITAKEEGTARITAYAKDGRGAKATCLVTIVGDLAVSNTPAVSTAPGTSATPGESVAPIETTEPTVVPTIAPTSQPALVNVEKTTEDITMFNTGIIPSVYIDGKAKDADGLNLIAKSFAEDIKLVSGTEATVVSDLTKTAPVTIIAGVVGDNDVIDNYVKEGIIDVSEIEGKWETYKIFTLKDKDNEGRYAVIVAGSDKRGTIYGIYYISELLGVSPWAYWGDVTPEKQNKITISNGELNTTSKEPSVKYRGIFLNDEAPSLTSWAKETYGGYNEKFYAKVYELILRLKGNYLWPAMWANCFSTDGTDEAGIANAKVADEFGVIMGTSHHEPLCRAGNEWNYNYKKYVAADKIVEGEGSGYYWNFDLFPDELTAFWKDGVKRNMNFENIYTIGMRGEADSALAMSTDTFKNIITTQKKILSDNGLADNPKVLVLYKEIETMWYDGDGSGNGSNIADWDGLDDTTIMLCEDNFGNMRTLPTEKNRNREAGWGMYYHFDYHGSPRSYEWIDTVSLQKTWEQMSMAYDYGVDDIWIVNVGDLKPMEMSTSYFLDMAYDFNTWGTTNKDSADEYTKQWVAAQFGDELNETEIEDVSSIMTEYLNLNSCRKPEIVLSNTYSVSNYNEALNMLKRCQELIDKSQRYMDSISNDKKAAYFQLVHYPAAASANVNRMQIYAALNDYYYSKGSAAANLYGTLINSAVEMDEDLTDTYNKNMYNVGTKWRYMMSAPHVGFTGWNSSGWTYPEPKWVKTKAMSTLKVTAENNAATYESGDCTLSDFTSMNKESYGITISNGGGKAYNYSVTPSDDWIVCSKTRGTIYLQDMVSVSVDWSKVTADQTGTVVIEGADSSVTVHVNAKVMDTTSLADKTYVETNGYISMAVENYTKNQAGKNGEKYAILKNYSKYGTAAKVYKTTASFDDFVNAPYLEYTFQANSDGQYNVYSYMAPTNNLDWNNITLRYGLSVDGGEISTIDTIDGTKFKAGDHNTSNGNNWSYGVMDNIRITSSKVTLAKGVHTLRFYAKDAGMVLEKLVLSKDELPTSYFGPTESYYVGKTGSMDTYIPEFDDMKFSLPGVIDAATYVGTKDATAANVTATTGTEYSYPVILTEDGTYIYKVNAKSDDNAVVQLKLDGKSLGTATVSGDDTYFIGENESYSGEGTLTLSVTSGTATISTICTYLKDTSVGLPAYVSASSNDGTKAYDKDEETTWSPSSVDMEDGDASITIDFEQNYYADHFMILGSAEGLTSYDVLMYDGKSYVTVYTGTKIKDGTQVYFQGKEAYHGRKMKFVFHGGTPKISEIKVTPYINWALEDDVTLSGHDKSGNDCVVPDTVADGNRITTALASSTMGSGSEVIMKFTQARTMDQLNIICLQEDENTKAGTGMVPDDSMVTGLAQTTYTAYYYYGGQWVIGGSVTQSDATKRKVINNIKFPHKVTAEAVKVVVNTSYWVRIVEMEPVLTYRNSQPNTLASQSFDTDTTEYEAVYNKTAKTERIQVTGTVKPEEVTISLKDTSGKYSELTDYDIWEEDNGFSIIPVKSMEAASVKISSAETVNISKIVAWEKLPEENISTDTILHEETFEKGQGNMGAWAESTIDVTRAQAYQGNKSLVVTNRTSDYSSVIINLANIVGVTDNETVYTLTYYVKSSAGELTMKNTICNLLGNNLEEDNGKTTVIKDNEWTKIEYKFSMKTADYRYFKLETVGDKEGSNGAYTDYYIDNLTMGLTEAPCTCTVDAMPQFTTTDEDLVIPKEKTGLNVSLKATCDVSNAGCAANGHKEGTVSTYYSLLSYDCDSASIKDGNLIADLGTETSGSVIVKVTASINGKSRSYAKKFNITVSNQEAEGYDNFALASNGSTITASAGENNQTNLPYLVDGDTTDAGANHRFRTNKLPAYIELRFADIIDVSKIVIFGQDASHPIHAGTISYMKDGEWVAFADGTFAENQDVTKEFIWNDSVATPAIRIDLPAAAVDSSDGYARFTEIQAFGTPHSDETGCQCQLGVPVYTGKTSVVTSSGEETSTLPLSAEVLYSTVGCDETGHGDKTPILSYSIIEDEDNIASISGSDLVVKNSEITSTVTLAVKASMNGKETTATQIIKVKSSDYENVAQASNGASVTVTAATSDAANIIDGDRTYASSKRWRPGTFPCTADITFSEERTIQEVDLFTQQDANLGEPTKTMTNKSSNAVSKFNIYYWNATSSDWTLIENGGVIDNNKVWNQFKLSEGVTTTKLRVEFIETVADGYARIVEMEAWSAKEASEPVDLTKVNLAGFSTLGAGTGAYDSTTDSMAFTFAASKERLSFALSPEQIDAVVEAQAAGKTVKFIVTASTSTGNTTFDICLASLNANNWNGTALGKPTYGSTEAEVTTTAAFSTGTLANRNNYSYVTLRITGVLTTLTIKKISLTCE